MEIALAPVVEYRLAIRTRGIEPTIHWPGFKKWDSFAVMSCSPDRDIPIIAKDFFKFGSRHWPPIYAEHQDTRLDPAPVTAYVGTEGNELAGRMAMLGVQSNEKKLRLYQEKIDIPTLLKMRPG